MLFLDTYNLNTFTFSLSFQVDNPYSSCMYRHYERPFIPSIIHRVFIPNICPTNGFVVRGGSPLFPAHRFVDKNGLYLRLPSKIIVSIQAHKAQNKLILQYHSNADYFNFLF